MTSKNTTTSIPKAKFQNGEILVPGAFDIKVIDTDYTNYAILHNCNKKIPSLPFEQVQVAVRSSGINYNDTNVLNKIAYDLQMKIGFQMWEISVIGRNGCPLL